MNFFSDQVTWLGVITGVAFAVLVFALSLGIGLWRLRRRGRKLPWHGASLVLVASAWAVTGCGAFGPTDHQRTTHGYTQATFTLSTGFVVSAEVDPLPAGRDPSCTNIT